MQTNNTQFEEQAKAILYLRHPRYFRAAFEKDQDFWTIYVYATAIAFVGDERIGRSIKYMYTTEPDTHIKVYSFVKYTTSIKTMGKRCDILKMN